MTSRDVAFLRVGVAGRCGQNSCKHHSQERFAHNHLLGRSLIGVHRTLPLADSYSKGIIKFWDKNSPHFSVYINSL
jgi:hypothetical protein